MRTFLAIDFGTSQTSVAVLPENSMNSPTVVEINDGHGIVHKAIATALQVDNEGRLIEFGSKALAKADENFEHTFYNFKPFLGGKGSYQQKTEQDNYAPDRLTFLFLQRLREAIEEYHFNGVKLAKLAKNRGLVCVFGCPSDWNEPRKNKLKSIAEKAGFPHVTLCDEPVGVIYYSHLLGGLSLDKTQNVLVYDFGGGTTDVAIAQINKDKGQIKPAILAASGLSDVGGMNFDQAIAARYITQNGYDLWSLSTQDRLHDQYIIEREAKRAKEKLSQKDIVDITINRLKVTNGEKPQKLSFSRNDFETACKVLIDKFDEPIYEALDYAGLSPDKIDHVILAGGSSSLPYVRERMSAIFSKGNILLYSSVDVLAQGLALYGRTLVSDKKEEPSTPPPVDLSPKEVISPKEPWSWWDVFLPWRWFD